MNRNRVVVTGLGVLAANGIGLENFWSSLCRGESGIAPVTLCDVTGLSCKIAGEVKDFHPEEYLDGKIKPKRLSRTSQFAVAASKLAVEDAGISRDEMRHVSPIPVRLGLTKGGLDYLESQIRKIAVKGPESISPFIVGAVDTASLMAIVDILDFNADLKSISTSCAAGMDAIIESFKLIERREADVAIAGGTGAEIETCMMASLSAARMLSTYQGDPAKASRPFDKRRMGGVLAEGSGMLVLESRNHALARGATIYAEIVGSGVSIDLNEDACSGLRESIEQALQNAGWLPNKIDSIYAHGAGDMKLDITETKAIKDVFGEYASKIPVTSIKGVTGNPLSAGGPLQVIAAAMGLYRNQIVPTANYEYPDPDCDLPIVYGRVAKTNAKSALINSHGIHKVNNALILKRAD